MTIQSTDNAVPSSARPIKILGTGEYLPVRCMDSASFDQKWQRPAGWTAQQTGICKRYFADNKEESSSYMAARAAQDALAAAQLSVNDIDCIISACSVMEQAIPCSAVLIQKQLGLADSGVPAFDINATCLSFMVALDLASTLLSCGRYRRILIASSEIAATGINWDDEETSSMFGDGAAAVLVGVSDDDSRLLSSRIETYSAGADHCVVRSGGTRINPRENIEAFLAGAHFDMSGRATYRMAARLLPAFVDKLFAGTGHSLATVHKVVPHQASKKALEHLQAAFAIAPERMINILAERGNQMAASLPVALHHALTVGNVQRGDVLVLIGTGAGLSLGGLVLRY